VKKVIPLAVLSVMLCVSTGRADDANSVPDNFPSVTAHVYDANALADGYIFLAVATDVHGVGYYLMVLNNDGTPHAYKELPDDYAYDFKVQPNGLISYAQFTHQHSYSGGGDCIHTLLDHNLQIVEEIQLDNGYFAEAHDFHLLPNGHALLFGYYMSQADMSQIVFGGHPAAQISGGIIQELDAQRHAVFQWRSWDAYDLADFPTTSAVTSAWHLDAISMDVDGNILLATPVEIKKISRQTGQILYHLGGDENEFTFVGDEADPSHMGGHAFHRIQNGNVLIYDNGNRRGTRSSQVHEYKLDEVNKIAEHVWSYVPERSVAAWHRGNAQRLPNGNTFIGWGGASGRTIPTCSEVTPEGEVVFEMFFDDPAVESYRAYRLPFPAEVEGIEVMEFELATGNTYRFAYGGDDTGVTIKVINRVGDGYNEVVVNRMPYAPLNPEFPGKAPRVLPVRFTVSQYGIQAITGQIMFDAAPLEYDDPNTLTVYYRALPDAGLFIPLATTYNPATEQVRASMFGFGEFVLGYPDVADVPFTPLLNEPESAHVKDYMTPYPPKVEPSRDYTVNQELPIRLSWSPVGLATAYGLQISTDPNFAVLDVNEIYLTEARYTFGSADGDTTYYWRVNTLNDGGISDWATGSFTTVPPMIRVTAPNGGESFKRGTTVYIRWQDNLDEDVAIELVKGGVPMETLDTVASNGAVAWEVSLTLQPGDDYAVRIKSTTDKALADASDANFTVR
jgi:hypothetical protein